MSSLWSKIIALNKIFLHNLRNKTLLKSIRDKSISERIRIGLAKENVKVRTENVGKTISATTQVMFGKYLFISNVSISVILSATGDTLEQYYRNHISSEPPPGDGCWNSTRTLHMSLSGASVGVFCHHGYRILDRLYPDRALKTVFKKVLFDQIFISPILISVFFVTLGLIEHTPREEICKETCDKGRRLYLAEWVVWPPAQMINFLFLSGKYRVLYDNTISLGYDVYTSYVKHDHS